MNEQAFQAALQAEIAADDEAIRERVEVEGVCPDCLGTGAIGEPCSYCDASGWILDETNPRQWYDCPRCRGSEEVAINCPTCEGTGRKGASEA